MQSETCQAQVTRQDLVQWAVAALALFLILKLKLLSTLLAGLLVYELVHVLAERLRLSSIGRHNAKPVAVALLTTLVVLLLSLAIIGIGSVLRHGNDSLPALLQKLAEIIDNSRQRLPESIVDYLPADADDLRQRLATWLRTHAGALGGASLLAGRVFAHVLIGLVIGALLALGETVARAPHKPLSQALTARAAVLSNAFRRVVFAQTWIAAINAGFTGIYLVLVLPLCGVHLPLTKTMVALTFIAGLIPIVGNLVSNSVIVIVSLSSSFGVALASTLFLVAVHKLEYFLNARIIGAHIRARAWELLVAMVVMEAAFGISGIIAAPIFYAYFKEELGSRGLV
jgi:predicted PurR-regulated permease PerM